MHRTAYGMRISAWVSYVCSSDLPIKCCLDFGFSALQRTRNAVVLLGRRRSQSFESPGASLQCRFEAAGFGFIKAFYGSTNLRQHSRGCGIITLCEKRTSTLQTTFNGTKAGSIHRPNAPGSGAFP